MKHFTKKMYENGGNATSAFLLIMLLSELEDVSEYFNNNKENLK